LYHESDLLVCEVLTDGMLDGLDADDLAGLASCLTYEHRSRVPPAPPRFPNARLRDRYGEIEARAKALVAEELTRDLPATRPPDATLVAATRAWAKGAPLEQVLEHDELSPGDFVRNMKQLIDLLRQVGEVAPDASTRDAAREASRRLFRGVVAAAVALPGGAHDDEPDAGSEPE
jgi:ATP-dependent RNA helicase HelY